MTPAMIPDADVDRALAVLQKDAASGGYFLNPDTEFVKNLIRGLLKNEGRYGYRACPCRLASGKREEDTDIICPCDYRDPDLGEHGACYCALYVDAAIAGGSRKAGPVPERRPPRALRGKTGNRPPQTGPGSFRPPGAVSPASQPVQTVGVSSQPFSFLPYPVWRCRVCGYLCAREEPPGICPVCKATRERFERFM